MAIPLDCPSCGKRLNAPDSSAGKKAKCPACGTIVVVPDVIRDAEEVGAAPNVPPPRQADDLYDFLNKPQAAAQPPAPVEDASSGQPRRPCPICGEMIVVGAAKCRFCNATFDPLLRHQEQKKVVKSEDSDLQTGDWLLAILCSGIGCIMGIVWLIQGKPKGGKMLGISLLFVVLWNIVSAVLQSIAHQGPNNFR